MTTNARQKSKAANDAGTKTTAPTKAATPTEWKGEEVEDGPASADSAEARASRAEGNAPILASVVAQQAQAEETGGTKTAEKRAKAPPSSAADDEENAEEKRLAAAEEHAAALAHHHPRGSL